MRWQHKKETARKAEVEVEAIKIGKDGMWEVPGLPIRPYPPTSKPRDAKAEIVDEINRIEQVFIANGSPNLDYYKTWLAAYKHALSIITRHETPALNVPAAQTGKVNVPPLHCNSHDKLDPGVWCEPPSLDAKQQEFVDSIKSEHARVVDPEADAISRFLCLLDWNYDVPVADSVVLWAATTGRPVTIDPMHLESLAAGKAPPTKPCPVCGKPMVALSYARGLLGEEWRCKACSHHERITDEDIKPAPNALLNDRASHTLASAAPSPAATPGQGQVGKKDGKAVNPHWRLEIGDDGTLFATDGRGNIHNDYNDVKAVINSQAERLEHPSPFTTDGPLAYFPVERSFLENPASTIIDNDENSPFYGWGIVPAKDLPAFEAGKYMREGILRDVAWILSVPRGSWEKLRRGIRAHARKIRNIVIDDPTPEEEAGLAEGEADIAAGRVYTEEEFKKHVDEWKDEPAPIGSQHAVPRPTLVKPVTAGMDPGTTTRADACCGGKAGLPSTMPKPGDIAEWLFEDWLFECRHYRRKNKEPKRDLGDIITYPEGCGLLNKISRLIHQLQPAPVVLDEAAFLATANRAMFWHGVAKEYAEQCEANRLDAREANGAFKNMVLMYRVTTGMIPPGNRVKLAAKLLELYGSIHLADLVLGVDEEPMALSDDGGGMLCYETVDGIVVKCSNCRLCGVDCKLTGSRCYGDGVPSGTLQPWFWEWTGEYGPRIATPESNEVDEYLRQQEAKGEEAAERAADERAEDDP